MPEELSAVPEKLRVAVILAAGQVAGGALAAAVGGEADTLNYMNQVVNRAFDEVIAAVKARSLGSRKARRRQTK